MKSSKDLECFEQSKLKTETVCSRHAVVPVPQIGKCYIGGIRGLFYPSTNPIQRGKTRERAVSKTGVA